MARVRVLNPGAAGPSGDPVALSRAILGEALTVRRTAECARLEGLTGRLRDVDPAQIEGDAARIALWANLYNALLLHCLCLRPVRGSILRHLRMFDRVAYQVGGHAYSLNLIEHGVLRGNRRPPLRPRRTLRGSDPRLAAAPAHPDPRIHFALNCGARSCPPVAVYAPETLDEQLDGATRTYLEAETALDPERPRVSLPRLMRIYRADFGRRQEQLRFAACYLPELEKRLQARGGRLRVRYGRFDWTAAAEVSG